MIGFHPTVVSCAANTPKKEEADRTANLSLPPVWRGVDFGHTETERKKREFGPSEPRPTTDDPTKRPRSRLEPTDPTDPHGATYQMIRVRKKAKKSDRDIPGSSNDGVPILPFHLPRGRKVACRKMQVRYIIK